MPSARTLLLALAICVAGLLAYLPSLPGEFIWDDDAHVTHNSLLREPDALGQIWVPQFEPIYKPNTPHYYPLSFTALWLEFRAFGLDPLGYHLVNLALHLANALLVWAVFARLRLRGAWLVGALFALHPMHVETTAWAMEIKNLLSGTFYLLAALAYLRFDECRGAWSLSAGLFLCALFAKTITCTLPAALVLALAFRDGRIDWRRLKPLVPLFVLGIGLALNTAWLEHNFIGAQGAQFVYSPSERVLIAARVLLFYPFKLLLPWPNLFVYPRWAIDPSSPAAWWPVLALLALTGGALCAWRKGWRGPVLALGFYAISILPASGIVTYYPMLFSFVADHFCYLPSLGVLALVAATLRGAAAVVVLALLGGLTALQSAHFASAEALYRHTLAHNPEAWLARTQLAQVLLPDGQPWKQRAAQPPDSAKLHEAEELLRSSLLLKEDDEITHYNLALCLQYQGRLEEARPHALRAAELVPGHHPPQKHEITSVAALLAYRCGDKAGAETLARGVLAADPGHYRSLRVLGDCLLDRGELTEARAVLVRALRAAPNAAARQLTAQELPRTFARTTSTEALQILDALARELGGLPPELERLRQAAAGRR